MSFWFFFFNDTATTEIYTLSLHDALPISHGRHTKRLPPAPIYRCSWWVAAGRNPGALQLHRSEEHTSELQSRQYLVCRLLLEKKNTTVPESAQLSLAEDGPTLRHYSCRLT